MIDPQNIVFYDVLHNKWLILRIERWVDDSSPASASLKLIFVKNYLAYRSCDSPVGVRPNFGDPCI